MDVTPESQAILAAKAFAIERGLRFEEPIFVRSLDQWLYHVTLTVEGASAPDVVIDPPEFTVQVDLKQDKVTLVPAM